MFVHCQNKAFGCDWQGLYGDCAEHLAKSCFAVQPEQLLKRLEDAEVQRIQLAVELAASRVEIDDLKAENRTLREDNADLHKEASERLGQKYILEAEVAQMKADLEALRAQGKEEKSRLLVDVARLEAQARSLQEQGDIASVRLAHGASDLQKVQAKLRGRNRLVWNLEEKLRRATKRRRDGSSRSSRARTPKRRRHGSAGSQMMSRRSSPPPRTSRPIDVDVDEGKAPWERSGVSPILSWTTGKGQCFY